MTQISGISVFFHPETHTHKDMNTLSDGHSEDLTAKNNDNS